MRKEKSQVTATINGNISALQLTITKKSKKSLAVKKMCGSQEGFCEKDVKSMVMAKKWLRWEVYSKNFNNDNSGEFGAKS